MSYGTQRYGTELYYGEKTASPVVPVARVVTQQGINVVGVGSSGEDVTQQGINVVGNPPYPHITATALGETSIRLIMTASPGGPTAHHLYRSRTPGFTPGPGNLIATYGAVPTSPVDDTGLLPGSTYYYALSGTVDGLDFFAYATATTTGLTPPELSAGAITPNQATLFVDFNSAMLEIAYEVYDDGFNLIDSGVQSGPNRFQRTVIALMAATTYTARARARYAAGLSEWAEIEFTTLTAAIAGDDWLSCPPVWPGVHVNPDGNPPNRLGVGFYRPMPGQPLRGTVHIRFRYRTSGIIWDFYLSDDLGVSWVKIADDVANQPADGDGLFIWGFEFDTTAYPDGADYRLKAVAQNAADDDWLSLSFHIDNAGDVAWWKYWDPVEDRFGVLWTQTGRNRYGYPENRGIWFRNGIDGGLVAIWGQDKSMLVDRLLESSLGGDITTRFYIWSGEGGRFGLGGRDDTEGFNIGHGFFGRGESRETQQGLSTSIGNLVTWPLGCCQDYLTSYVAAPATWYAENPGAAFTDTRFGWPGETPIAKMFFKAIRFPHWLDLPEETLARWPYMSWRQGPAPGEDIQWAFRSCARRFEDYVMRTRVQVDGGNPKRINVKCRIDGPGVEEPTSGYWHLDDDFDRSADWDYGLLGMVSDQIIYGLYSAPAGAREFLLWSALPLDVGGDIEPPPPTELPPFTPPTEGQPCTLILQVFEDDRETLAWEVGTDRDHFNPYLTEPENYGEQELDLISGAATIGQAEVIVVDRRQTEGDQDSGWLTERVHQIHGYRNRLLRYIDYELGWIVIADGPASTPQLDETYAAYRWVIRDTRETERKVKAFVETNARLLPMSYQENWGAYTDPAGDPAWLVSPMDPLVGLFNHYSYGGYLRGRVTFDEDISLVGGDYEVTEGIMTIPGVEELVTSPGEPLGDPRPIYYEYPDIEIWWRVHESGDPWTVIVPTDIVMPGEENLLLRIPGAPSDPAGATDDWWPARSLFGAASSGEVSGRDVALADGTEVRAVFYLFMMGYLAVGDFPAHNTRIEVLVRYTGEPNSAAPLLIDGLNTGQLLKKFYDGEYSYRDPITDEVVETGIRYYEPDLLQMNNPVRLRITEPVDDLRTWAEEKVYAPTGWVAALDNDGRISPKSQVPPEDFSPYLEVNDAITEPQPDWTAGEKIINVLGFTYPRFYPADPADVESVDRLAERTISHEWRNEASIDLHGIESVTYDGQVFAAVGDEYGYAVQGLQNEIGYGHAVNRHTYIFHRYQLGAPIIEVPVRRDYCAEYRAGDWIRVDLSWFPEAESERRQLRMGGQILAIHDVDCEWRVLLIEKVEPYIPVS